MRRIFIKALAVAASLSIYVVASPALAGEEADSAWRDTVLDYGWLMTKAGFCKLTTQYAVKSEVLAIFGTMPGADIASAEAQLNSAADGEQSRHSATEACQPDEVSKSISRLTIDLQILASAISSGR